MKVYFLCLIALVAFVSCSATAKDVKPKVSMDFPKADNISFTIRQGTDPLKICKVVQGEITKRGYKVNVKSVPDVVNGIEGTYALYMGYMYGRAMGDALK
jgi:ABC-type metal ion transport system substrate-binding protein